MSASDLPVQVPLLTDAEREDEAEDYSSDDELAARRAEEALLNDGRDLPTPARAYFIRSLALLCACSLSVGSH